MDPSRQAASSVVQGLLRPLSAVIDLDHIYLLENGEIIAAGNHEELLASSPLYQQIYESQLGGGVTAGLELEEVSS